MPYLASISVVFICVQMLHFHVGTCCHVCVGFVLRLCADTALVMCIIFKKKKQSDGAAVQITTLISKSQSVHPQSTKGELTKSDCFLTSASKMTLNLSCFCWLHLQTSRLCNDIDHIEMTATNQVTAKTFGPFLSVRDEVV